jgi:cobalt-zinc-cadmium resistance protein CzcA
VGLALLSQPLRAQQASEVPLTLNQAVEKAIDSYPAVQAAQLNVTKQENLKKTSWDLGKTGVFTAAEERSDVETGIVTVVGLQQQNIDLFSIPAKSQLQQAQIEVADTRSTLTAIQITKEVKNAYGKAYTNRRKLDLLERIDSVYRVFEQVVEFKYQVEESSELEYLAAANQARQINLELEQAKYDYRIAINNLNQWIYSDTLFTIDQNDPQLLGPIPVTESSIDRHPELALARNQILLSEKGLKAVRAEYLPKLNLMYGFQEVNGLDGFYQYQAGLSFPLICNKQQGMVQAAAIDLEISQQRLMQAELEVQSRYLAAEANYQKWQASWQYYQQEALPMSKRQLEGAALSYQAGAIDYVAFLQNTHFALGIELKGVEALNAYLDAKFQLEYLMEKEN